MGLIVEHVSYLFPGSSNGISLRTSIGSSVSVLRTNFAVKDETNVATKRQSL